MQPNVSPPHIRKRWGGDEGDGDGDDDGDVAAAVKV